MRKNSKKLKIISLFGGIECGLIGLKQFYDINNIDYYSSEINNNAIINSKHNFPFIKELNSVEDIHYDNVKSHLYYGKGANRFYNIKNIDLIIGGPPCQDLSIAGKQEGLSGKRSGLFYEYLRIVNEVKPKIFFMENVASMKQKDRDLITKSLFGIKPYEINSGDHSVQNRKRLYWIGKLNENGGYDRLELKFGEGFYKNTTIFDKGFLEEVDFNNSLVWNKCDEKYLTEFTKETLRINTFATGRILGRRLNENLKRCDYDKSKPIIHRFEVNHDIGKTGTLTTFDKDNVLGFFNKSDGKYYWRKFTLKEYSKIQGIPYEYNFITSKSSITKLIGNGWQVETVKLLLKEILLYL